MLAVKVVIPGPGRDQPPVDRLDTLRAAERDLARAHGKRARLLAEIAADAERSGDEFAAEQVAAELGWSPMTARNRLYEAEQLATRLSTTMAALAAGRIDWAKANALIHLTRPLTAGQAAQVEEWVLERAAEKPLAVFTACARRRVLKVDPDGAADRAVQRRKDRRIWLNDADDGMAGLGLSLPAEIATAAWNRIDVLARKVRTTGDGRTMDQIRADVAADLLLSSHGTGGSAVSVQLNVTIDALTLLGLRENPARLHGHGPIDAATARELAADATWRRIITDPTTGMLLDIGRRRYRPPAAMADHVILRDKTCQFPGCRRQAETSDLDHGKQWSQGGSTSADNLCPLCRRHHRLKHETAWQLEQTEPGHFRWTSPTGRVYTIEPEPISDTVVDSDTAVLAAHAGDETPPF